MAELRFLERAQYKIARALIAGVSPQVERLKLRRARVIDGLTLHPELQLMLALRDMRGAKSWAALSVDAARAQLREESRLSAGPRVHVGPVRTFDIPGPTGHLRVRHYAPLSSAPRPLLVFFHGGGFVLGDLDSHDQPCRILCRHADVHVLSVDYRLSPEHPFPAGLEDCYSAFRWARAHAEILGADPGQIAVGGDSAGANLATAVALKAKAAGEPGPTLQVLFYPSADRVRGYASESYFATDYLLTSADITWCTERYAGGEDLRHPLISPLFASDLRGLGTVLVITAGFDPLRDEGEAYERALAQAGNPTQLRRFSSLIHGFINMTGLSAACESALLESAHLTKTLLETAKQT